eukprot:CAMPEP_0115128930 /NCGR_PEP_ID=MMETSP0227-20121206/51466_1 /TAXON_ID=89957 /ORGANISM="Polarella glacialis, Strain CCMP 1383" /LENGTH=46 /DNA_ID= /DNA_START= /DNA_END= /DNA_ORIENTATION=
MRQAFGQSLSLALWQAWMSGPGGTRGLHRELLDRLAQVLHKFVKPD